jgi:hypothetical protein
LLACLTSSAVLGVAQLSVTSARSMQKSRRIVWFRRTGCRRLF